MRRDIITLSIRLQRVNSALGSQQLSLHAASRIQHKMMNELLHRCCFAKVVHAVSDTAVISLTDARGHLRDKTPILDDKKFAIHVVVDIIQVREGSTEHKAGLLFNIGPNNIRLSTLQSKILAVHNPLAAEKTKVHLFIQFTLSGNIIVERTACKKHH